MENLKSKFMEMAKEKMSMIKPMGMKMPMRPDYEPGDKHGAKEICINISVNVPMPEMEKEDDKEDVVEDKKEVETKSETKLKPRKINKEKMVSKLSEKMEAFRGKSINDSTHAINKVAKGKTVVAPADSAGKYSITKKPQKGIKNPADGRGRYSYVPKHK